MADDIGTITTIGAQKFNEHYMSETRRIMFCGARVSQSPSPFADPVGVDNLKARDSLIPEIRPAEGLPFIRVANLSAQDDGEYPIAQLTVLLSRSVAGLEDVEKIHEIGIYAQVCQNEPPTYFVMGRYRAGDIVRDEASGNIYRSKKYGNQGQPLTNTDWWEQLPRPFAEQTLTNQRWYPVPTTEGDPFLFYVIMKHEHPLCLTYNLTLRYSLNIQLLGDEQLKQVYLSPEEMHGFPEVQLAYLENISQAMRGTRDQQRINAVAIRSLGQARKGMLIYKDDVISANDTLWKCYWQPTDSSYPGHITIGDLQNFIESHLTKNNKQFLELTPDLINMKENWDFDKTYNKYDTAVHTSSVWISDLADNREEPGSSTQWRKLW